MIAQSAIQPGIRAAPLCGAYTGKPRVGKEKLVRSASFSTHVV